MLEVSKLAIPSPEQFNSVISGMRLPMKSGDKSDSGLCGTGNCDKCSDRKQCWNYKDDYAYPYFHLGEKDKQLLLNLCKAGDPSHRKVLRQLPIIAHIRAPLYWWKQIDQYKIGTTTNSESTMHCLVKKPFTIEDFSVQDDNEEDNFYSKSVMENTITDLNLWRDIYLDKNDIRYWTKINQHLPQSYMQTRCWSGNYENTLAITFNRYNHKLSEWHDLIQVFINELPYFKDILSCFDGFTDKLRAEGYEI